jgi:hypothetical protein
MLPPRHALARIGFRKRPQVPRTAIRFIRGDGATRKISHHIRTATRKPVRIRENHEGTSVARLVGHDLLVDGRSNFGDIAIRFYSSNECVGHRGPGELAQPDPQLRGIAVDLVIIHRGGNFRIKV